MLRDAGTREQWCYVQKRPRLTEIVDADGQIEPELSLLRYLGKMDPAIPIRLDGGILQFGAPLQLPDSIIQPLIAAIKNSTHELAIQLTVLVPRWCQQKSNR